VTGVKLVQVLASLWPVGCAGRLSLASPVGRRVLIRLVAPFSLFLAVCILSTVHSVSLDTSWGYIRNWIGSLLLAFLVAHVIRTRRQLLPSTLLLLLITASGATLGVLQRYVRCGSSLGTFVVA